MHAPAWSVLTVFSCINASHCFQNCDARVLELTEKFEAADQEAQRSRVHLETVMTSARLTPSEVDRGGTVAISSQPSPRDLALEAPDGANMSYTKLYMQWQELQDENRRLQRTARKNVCHSVHPILLT